MNKPLLLMAFQVTVNLKCLPCLISIFLLLYKTVMVLGVEPDYLLYSKVLPHWTLVHNGEATPAVKYSLQGGSRGR